MPKTYACVRLSKNSNAIEMQKEAICSFADAKGLSVDQWLEIDAGNQDERLSEIKKGDVLLTAKLFRLGNDVHDIMKTLQGLLAGGVLVYSCEDGSKFGADGMTSAMVYCFGLAAGIAKEARARLTKEALEIRKREGKKLGRPCGRGNKKLLLTDRKEKIAELFKENCSVAKIARSLDVDVNTLRRFIRRFPELRENADAK